MREQDKALDHDDNKAVERADEGAVHPAEGYRAGIFMVALHTLQRGNGRIKGDAASAPQVINQKTLQIILIKI